MERDVDRSPRHGGSMDRVSKSSIARCSSPHAFPDCSTADRSGLHGRRTRSRPQSPQTLKEPAMGFNSHALAGKSLLASRSEEHTSELQSLMRISYAVFCLQKKQKTKTNK